jgi:hypothetical protein
MLTPQVLDGEPKSLALLPLKETLDPGNGMVSEVLFVSVTVFGTLVTPRG